MGKMQNAKGKLWNTAAELDSNSCSIRNPNLIPNPNPNPTSNPNFSPHIYFAICPLHFAFYQSPKCI